MPVRNVAASHCRKGCRDPPTFCANAGQRPVEARAVAALGARVDPRRQALQLGRGPQARPREDLVGGRAALLEVVGAEQRDEPAAEHEGERRLVAEPAGQTRRLVGELLAALLLAGQEVQPRRELGEQTRAERRRLGRDLAQRLLEQPVDLEVECAELSPGAREAQCGGGEALAPVAARQLDRLAERAVHAGAVARAVARVAQAEQRAQPRASSAGASGAASACSKCRSASSNAHSRSARSPASQA